MRNRVSTILELSGATAITAGAATIFGLGVGLIIGGTFSLVFGVRMGNG